MINVFEVRNSQGDILTFPLQDVSSGFVVRNIEGLDPVKATLVSSSFAKLDGEQYQSSRRESRNIKLQLGLEPDFITKSVRDLRKQLYDFFMPKTEVVFFFHLADGLIVTITGRIESLETPLFVKEPAVDISILCYDPDFVDPEVVTISDETTNEPIDEDAEIVINYEGTVETGIKLTLNVDRNISEFTVYHRAPDGTLYSLDFAADLDPDDVLVINTVTGSKGAILTRDAINSSILYGVSPQANWLELQPGENRIRFYATGASIPFDLEYVTRYGGL